MNFPAYNNMDVKITNSPDQTEFFVIKMDFGDMCLLSN